MKVAIMEPYFFPYLGHFDLINSVDHWIVFDTAQYIRHGWGNRNRMLHPTTGWLYIIAPLVKYHQKTPFNGIFFNMRTDWKARILGQLGHYEKNAPHYPVVVEFLTDCFANPETNLAKFNTTNFTRTARLLGIDTPISIFSEMNLPLEPVDGPGDWGLRIAQAFGASELLNPPRGAPFMCQDYYGENGIKLTFQVFENMTYKTGKYQFEPALSILDVMMWNSPKEIKHYLDTFHFASQYQEITTHA